MKRTVIFSTVIVLLSSCGPNRQVSQLDRELPLSDRIQRLMDDPEPYAHLREPASDIDAERFAINDALLGKVSIARYQATSLDGVVHDMQSFSFSDLKCSFVKSFEEKSVESFVGGDVEVIERPSWAAADLVYRVGSGPLKDYYVMAGARCPQLIRTSL